MGSRILLTEEFVSYQGILSSVLQAVLLSGDTWTPGGSEPTAETLPSVTEPRDTYQKEQILELLVLEPFVTILPEELQVWVWEHNPESGEKVVTVLGDLEREIDEPRQQMRN